MQQAIGPPRHSFRTVATGLKYGMAAKRNLKWFVMQLAPFKSVNHLYQTCIPFFGGYFCTGTVDGKNPAPVDMVNIPLFTGFHTCQVIVWYFFHQQYCKFTSLGMTHLVEAKNPSSLSHTPTMNLHCTPGIECV